MHTPAFLLRSLPASLLHCHPASQQPNLGAGTVGYTAPLDILSSFQAIQTKWISASSITGLVVLQCLHLSRLKPEKPSLFYLLHQVILLGLLRLSLPPTLLPLLLDQALISSDPGSRLGLLTLLLNVILSFSQPTFYITVDNDSIIMVWVM